MTTAYSNLLGLALPVTGELSGTWGDTVNDYITKYLDDAIANAQVISGSQTAVTLSKTTGTALVSAGSGSTGSAQYALIRCTGNPASTLTITVSYASLTNSQFSKTYLIFNSTSTNQSVVVQATTSSGTSTGVTIAAGERALIAWNGTDFVKIATQSGTGEFVTVDTTNLEVTNIKAKDGTAAATIADSTGAITVSTLLNVDNLRLDGNTLSSTDSNGNVVLAPNGTGDVQLDADTVRIGDSNANATITTNGTGDLILNTNSGTNSGSITIEDGVNGNIIIAPNGTGQVQITNAALDLTTIEVSNINAKDGTAAITIADSTGAVGISTAVTMSATTQNINLGTSQTTGTFTVGGASQTGTQTFDQSTKTHTLNLGTGATESGLTKTINLGTGGVATSTTAINIGSANGTTTTLNGTVTAATLNSTTIDTTNLEVTNIKAKDGTASMSIADSTGVVSVSANPVLSGGTANGVLYLDGSKVATSGSALTFNGTNFRVVSDVRIEGTGVGITGSGDGAEIYSNSGVTYFQGFNRTTSAYIPIIVSGGTYISQTLGGFERMRLTGTSLNIGGNFTSTNNTLQVTGTVAIGDTLAAPTDGLYVKGSVGIGTNSPGEKLELTGNIRMPWNASNITAYNSSTYYQRIDFRGDDRELRFVSGGLENPFITFYTGTSGGTEKARIDTSGNLGLGVTPESTWAIGGKVIQISGRAYWGATSTNELDLGLNAYYDGAWKYLTTSTASAANYSQQNGKHIWQTVGAAAAHTKGDPLSWIDAMTLDASGNLGVGQTNPTTRFETHSQTGGTQNIATIRSSNVLLKIGTTDISNGEVTYNAFPAANTALGSAHIWQGGGTERARITSGGNFLVGTQTSYQRITVGEDGSSVSTAPAITFYDVNSGGSRAWCIANGISAAGTSQVGALTFSRGSAAYTDNPLSAGVEVARFTSGGYFKAKNDGAYTSSGSFHEFVQTNDAPGLSISCSNASLTTYGVAYIEAARNTTNNTFYAISYYNTGAAAYKFRVADSGAVATAGSITLGSIAPATSGIGVQFPATQSASSDANTLDDYEEGLHTAVITTGTSGTVTLSSIADRLAYTKVGRQVTVIGGLTVDSVSSPVGFFNVSLPFAIGDLDEVAGRASGSVTVNDGNGPNVADFVVLALEGESGFRVYLGDAASVQTDSANALQTGAQIYVSFTYFV